MTTSSPSADTSQSNPRMSSRTDPPPTHSPSRRLRLRLHESWLGLPEIQEALASLEGTRLTSTVTREGDIYELEIIASYDDVERVGRQVGKITGGAVRVH